MSDLFRKLNILLKAGIKDVLGNSPLQHPLRSRKLGKDLQSEVEMLRGRINDAIAHEETLKAKVDLLRLEAEKIDQEADGEVQVGNEAQARYLIGQLQRKYQFIGIAEADLREHQLVTQDLIQRVNMLDAVVAEAQNQQRAESTSDMDIKEEQISESESKLTNTLRNVRETMSSIADNIATVAQEGSSKEASSVDTQSADDERMIGDDLDSRRQRLSKPK